MKPFALVAVLAFACAPGFGADREFDSLVRRIESRYGTNHTHIPMLGLANFFVHLIRPAGATDMQLAVFEDMRRPIVPAGEEFNGIVASSLGQEWHPFVVVHSNHDREWTCIYSSIDGARMKLLIATLERHDATVIRVKLDTEATKRWFDDPARMGKQRGSD